ncbi:MAG: HD domain-containing protein [Bacteroidales bacterium]|nr:HD domain-containing protein [Bacteroidales bacterium]
MISEGQLKKYKTWFKNYVETFYSNDKQNKNVYKIKYEHSLGVCTEINDIGNFCGLSKSELRLAESIALFHDLGRFEQYLKFRTFADHKSLNHSYLAIKILKEYKILKDIDAGTLNLIYSAIENHNRKEIPYEIIGDELFYSKLLRDADKIDIFKVVIDSYTNEMDKNEAIELDLPDLPEIIEDNFLDIESGRIIKKENLKTLNDFKLMQISWLFDVNFERSFVIIKERCYLEKIFETLPKNEKINQIKKRVLNYLKDAVVK